MKVEEFKSVLNRLGSLYAAAGAATAAKDLQSVSRLLEGHEDKSIDEFVAEAKSLLDRPASTRESVSVNEIVVQSHAEHLLNAGTDYKRFHEALDTLEADKLARQKEWYMIANSYRNTPSGGTHSFKYTSIKAAKAAIHDAFIERFEGEGKNRIIERLIKWPS